LNSFPWIIKDPRLCVTFDTWVELIEITPVVLYSYRYPYDVAYSFSKAIQHIDFVKSLELWYIYNKLALQSSKRFCRVITSHDLIITHGITEINRILVELDTCGIKKIPKKIKNETFVLDVINKFIDKKLIHNSLVKNTTKCDPNSFLAVPDFMKDNQTLISLHHRVIELYCVLEVVRFFFIFISMKCFYLIFIF